MKHVVTAAPVRQRVLVTAFGAFPGAPTNPSAAILTRLEQEKPRLERLGIVLHCLLIPVVYDQIAPTLDRAVGAHQPDAILHLGLASRRRWLSIERQATNRASRLHPDASGRFPVSQVLEKGAPQHLTATYPAMPILAAIRRANVAARLSRDAGDYVCNATFYHALRDGAARQIGFLHVPRVRDPNQPKSRTKTHKPTLATLVAVTRVAIVLVGRRSRVTCLDAPASGPATADAPTVPPRDGAPETR